MSLAFIRFHSIISESTRRRSPTTSCPRWPSPLRLITLLEYWTWTSWLWLTISNWRQALISLKLWRKPNRWYFQDENVLKRLLRRPRRMQAPWWWRWICKVVIQKMKWNETIKSKCKAWRSRELRQNRRSRKWSDRRCNLWWNSSQSLGSCTCMLINWGTMTISEREIRSSRSWLWKLWPTKQMKRLIRMALGQLWTIEHLEPMKRLSRIRQLMISKEKDLQRKKSSFQKETCLSNSKPFQILKSWRPIQFGKRMTMQGSTIGPSFLCWCAQMHSRKWRSSSWSSSFGTRSVHPFRSF